MLDDGEPDGVVTLRLEGAAEHRGHILAHALAEKLGQFLRVFAAYERVHLGSRTRQTDFEIVTLSHNSPSELGLHPVPRVANYLPAEAVHWTLEQWDRIARGERPADGVDEDLVSDVAALARRPGTLDYVSFSIGYGHRRIVLDDQAVANAESIRRAVRPPVTLPWRAGISHGSVTGELRSVLDDHGERQIVILPPIGPDRIRCVFEEDMRGKVRDNLFHYVRVSGLLHYTSDSPHPVLVALDDIEPLDLLEPAAHFIDARGLFSDSVYPPRPADYM